MAHTGKPLPHGNLVIASHKEFQKLSQYDRYPAIVKSIAAEYNGFDDRCIWELVKVPKGETLHKMPTARQSQATPGRDGSENQVKMRSTWRYNETRSTLHGHFRTNLGIDRGKMST